MSRSREDARPVTLGGQQKQKSRQNIIDRRESRCVALAERISSAQTDRLLLLGFSQIIRLISVAGRAV